MSEPLPENPYSPNSHPLRFSAYNRCLELERSAEKAGSDPTISPQLCGRILGYMMREAPSSDGCDNVQREIASCIDDRKLIDLAKLYAMYILRLFKKAKCSTTGSSSHPSRPCFDDTQQTIAYLLEEASESNGAAKKLALIRDNYCCVVTGAYDYLAFDKRRARDRTFRWPLVRFTKAAHIFPDSLNQGFEWVDGLLGEKRQYTATAWAVMERFGQVNVLPESLSGPKIHRVENVLTMCFDIHELFDSLRLWFEVTDVPNIYKMCSNDEETFSIYSIPRQVTFTSTSPSISLPNSNYLRVHAACARVAHLSGAAEYLETVITEREEKAVLASDGGSADMLSFLLARAAIAAH